MNRLMSWTLALILGASTTLHAGDKLSDAAANCVIQTMKATINAGEGINDVDQWGWTALMWATFHDHESAVSWLLNHGADPNLKSTKPNRSFPVGTTALGIAAKAGHEVNLTLLLGTKANPETTDTQGTSPLAYAEKSGCKNCIDILQGKPMPPSPLHSIVNRVVKERLNDLFIVIDSCIVQSQVFLETVKTELDAELEKCHVRHLICILDPLNLDVEKEILARRDAFKPKYILEMSEISGTIKAKQVGTPRSQSGFHARLSLNGSPDPLWIKQFRVGEVHRGAHREGIVYKMVARELLDRLEADQLLEP